MQGYILRRVLASIPVLLMVAVLTFLLLYLTPGNPAYILAGEEASLEQVKAVEKKMGLDRPFHIRLGKWFATLAKGDLGESSYSRYKVTKLIKDRIGPTLSLSVLATVFAVTTAIPLGVIAAWKAHTWVDRTVMVFSSLGFAVPSFFLGFVIMWTFGINWELLPVSGYEPISDGFGPYIKRLLMPAATTALVFMALIARMTRASMLEVLQEDYIRTARAKGLGERLVLFRHALRNAALPILTIVGMGIALLVSGLVVVETVFAVPGLGRLVKEAIDARDYPVIQGMILVVASVYILINLVVDILYAYLDPRIRY